MAYLKPPKFTSKVFNPIAAATGIGSCEKVTFTGRKTGAQQSLPLIPVDVDGSRYLVSTRGESEWVRNVRVTPTVVVHNKSGTVTYQAKELPVGERAEVIAQYRRQAGKQVRGYWAKLPDDANHPVFTLTRAPAP